MGLFDYWRNLLSRPPQNQYEAQHRQEIQNLITQEYMTPKISYVERPRNLSRPSEKDWYKTAEGRRYLLSINPEFQKQHPAPEFDAYGNPLSLLDKQAYWNKAAHSIRRRDLDKAELTSTSFNSAPTKGFFPIAEGVLEPNYLHSYSDEGNPSYGPRSFVSLDIETDDRRRPLSISALKFVYDTKTGQFHSTGNYQRFYTTDLKNIRDTYATHGLTPAKLLKLRQQQGADYSTGYFTDPREEKALREFIGGATIVGQNVVGFDLPILFHGDVPRNNVIDTVVAARNVWKNMPNGLEDIFKRVMGKTMEEAGLSHHDANADTLATMMVLEKMARWKGPTGDAIRYVMSHQGVQLAPINEMLKDAGQVIRGTYQDINRSDDIGEYYMSAKKIRVRAKEVYGLSQSDINDMTDPSKLTDEELLGSGAAEVGVGLATGVSETVKELQAAYNSFAFWRKSKLVQEAAHARSSDEAWSILGSAFNTGGKEAGDLMIKAMSSRRAEALEDIREIRKRRGYVSKEDEHTIRTTKSFDELVDVMDKVKTKTQQLSSVFQAFVNIKPYDVNQYLHSAKNQWGGITGAARGVVPSFLLNPIERIGAATFNYQEGKLANLNAFNRAWNATAGQVGGAALNLGLRTGNPWAIGIGATLGTVGTVSQLVGNYKQGQMETAMLGVQNTLNTLGAMVSWITTPFKLLHRAAKLLIGSFSGLSIGINNFMKNGIGMMSQMGNPLSELTGVNYAAYEGTTMLDVASLFNRGSMNSIYEDFAKQQKAFYTLGQVNTNRLVASSLLGVYGDVYNPSTDTEGSYNAMVNKLLAMMQGQSDEQKQRTMYLASEIDSNLPSLLRTANMLGVTDINQLTDPSHRGMYWRSLSDAQEQRYRWTQYEYGAAQQQWGRSKMKISNWLWTAVGKDLYNGINGIVDQLSDGNWKGAMDEAKAMWEKFRTKLSATWKEIKGMIDGDEESGSMGWGKSFKLLGLQITNIALQVAKIVVSIWDDVMLKLVDKAEGLIAYLSTVSITPHYDRKTGEISFDINSIGTAKAPGDNAKVYETTYSAMGMPGKQVAAEGMAAYGKLADIVWADRDKWFKESATVGQLKYDTLLYAKNHGLDLSEYGFSIDQGQAREGTAAQWESLFNALGVAGQKDKQSWIVAAQLMANTPSSWKIENFDDTTGYAKLMGGLVGSTEDVFRNTIDMIQGNINNEIKLIIEAKDSTGKTVRTTLTGDGKSVVAKDFLQLKQMIAEGYNLVVQKQ